MKAEESKYSHSFSKVLYLTASSMQIGFEQVLLSNKKQRVMRCLGSINGVFYNVSIYEMCRDQMKSTSYSGQCNKWARFKGVLLYIESKIYDQLCMLKPIMFYDGFLYHSFQSQLSAVRYKNPNRMNLKCKKINVGFFKELLYNAKTFP